MTSAICALGAPVFELQFATGESFALLCNNNLTFNHVLTASDKQPARPCRLQAKCQTICLVLCRRQHSTTAQGAMRQAMATAVSLQSLLHPRRQRTLGRPSLPGLSGYGCHPRWYCRHCLRQLSLFLVHHRLLPQVSRACRPKATPRHLLHQH